MAFLAQIFAWIISDIRHIIIIAMSVLLIGMGVYCLTLKWGVADKDQKVSEFKTENARLTLNNTNLTAQNDQLRKANEALQGYVNDILKIKKDTAKIKESIDQMRSKEDEIANNNLIADSWNNRN